MIPYLASLEYYRAAVGGQSLPAVVPNRAQLAPDLMLTVPVAGGSAALKRFMSGRLSARKLEISQHGRWQHTHLGALEARLGRTPFWRHLEPSVAPLIAEASGSLEELNEALDAALKEFLDYEALFPELREMVKLNPARAAAIAQRIQRDADTKAPYIVLAARYGRDAIFALV